MGQASSLDYMNVASLSQVVSMKEDDLYRVLEAVEELNAERIHEKESYENAKSPSAILSKASIREDNNQFSDTSMLQTESLSSPVGSSISVNDITAGKSLQEMIGFSDKDYVYFISENTFVEILTDLQLLASDIELCRKMFHLVDLSAGGVVNIKLVLLSFSCIVTQGPKMCFLSMFNIMDRPQLGSLDKSDMIEVLKTANDALYYFGDRYLQKSQILDLVDSVYTSAGQIDGTIAYSNFVEYLATHPIVELLLSYQYQGTVQSKVLDEEQMEEAGMFTYVIILYFVLLFLNTILLYDSLL